MKDITLNEIKKLAYLYQAGDGMAKKLEELDHVLPKEELKRFRTAKTNLDKAVASTLNKLDIDPLRQINYIIKTHETCMIPLKDKYKYLKHLGTYNHLQDIRTMLCEMLCNYCTVVAPKKCAIHDILHKAGTPYFWDMENLDVLTPSDRALAEHCGYCGGIEDEQVQEEFKRLKEKRDRSDKLFHY